MTLTRRLIALFLALILLNGTTALACGPFTLEAIFIYTAHPAFPLQQFADGRIGVVQPSYARSYLYVAYRHLSGLNFSPAEQKALVDLWSERLGLGPDDTQGGRTDWNAAWTEARKKVPGVQGGGEVDAYRSREKPNEYEFYVNCNNDSFETAVKTLADRSLEYKNDTAPLLTWVSAQDQVFSNCGSGSSIPDTLPAEARLLERQDRAYQIAAANFYSANFDEARKRFEEVAADDKSPWHYVAAYMVARTLIRKASLGAPEQKQESLRVAENQLAKILADKTFAHLHPTATRLTNLIHLRLRPQERVIELGRVLTNKKQNDNLKQDLWDYTTLLDQNLDTPEKKSAEIFKADDLTDWIATIQLPETGGLDHALERWQTKRTDPWLVAVLSKLGGQHPKASELISQALNVKLTAAAFHSARFHAARLLMESGKYDEARVQFDQLLKNSVAQLDKSSFNLLMSKRMLVSTTLNEFLTYAARVPAAISWNEDGREIPADDETVSTEMKDIKGQPRFDYDAGMAFNQRIPLSILKTAAKSTALPTPLRRDLAQAVWLRAVILGDTKTADELAPVVSSLIPELSSLLKEYLSATTPQAKKSAAIYAWLKFPGLEPVVDIGIGRRTPLHEQELYRDNWWCQLTYYSLAAESAKEKEEDKPVFFTARNTQRLIFLSPAEQATAEREWKTLLGLNAAPNYIVQEVVQWANRTPGDQRVPEALHLAVKTTRFGCTNQESSRWSKLAFDLLHRKYPNSTWAKKTPYWFKD